MKLIYLNKHETNQSWGAEAFISKALSELGVSIHHIDYAKYQYQITKKVQRLNEHHIDGSLLQRGIGYNPPKSVLSLLPRPRILLITELTRRIPVQSYMWNEDLFDFFYVRTPECKNHLQERYLIPENKIEIFLSGFDDTLFYPKASNQDIDILFVGTMTERRAMVIEKLKSEFREKFVVTKAFGQELNALINRSRIVLNLHGTDALDTETRVYEVLGAGGFLITEKLSEESPFIHEREVIESNSIDEMIEKIAFFLDSARSSVREQIAKAGYKKAVQRHTYKIRSESILARFDSLNRAGRNLANRSSYLRAYSEEKIKLLLNNLTKPLIGFYHKMRTS